MEKPFNWLEFAGEVYHRINALETRLSKKFPDMGDVMTDISSLQARVKELELAYDQLIRMGDTVARLEFFEQQRQKQINITEPGLPETHSRRTQA